MGTTDKALGGVMLAAAATVFLYYTIWAIFLPVLEDTNVMHSFFPAREWAVRLPAFILVVGLTAIGMFVGSTIMKEKRRKAEKARLRTA
ncbi:dolichol phosphate-mannose biosynthesis regulatory [Coprinopsis sp. MPI-PUGE-AT-0042]|nr:dolichol phosphate-mannose biosynthesis regulatory [Coprinopsis sp. MPI-PUGE-AT-0042]